MYLGHVRMYTNSTTTYLNKFLNKTLVISDVRNDRTEQTLQLFTHSFGWMFNYHQAYLTRDFDLQENKHV